jgi:hypothetical protein
MGRPRSDILSDIRSPRKALSDLVAKYRSADPDHPDRAIWARMIHQLKYEIAVRGPEQSPYLCKAACADCRFSP